MILARCALFIVILLAFLASASSELPGTFAQHYNQNPYQSLQWRWIGPFCRGAETQIQEQKDGGEERYKLGVNDEIQSLSFFPSLCLCASVANHFSDSFK